MSLYLWVGDPVPLWRYWPKCTYSEWHHWLTHPFVYLSGEECYSVRGKLWEHSGVCGWQVPFHLGWWPSSIMIDMDQNCCPNVFGNGCTSGELYLFVVISRAYKKFFESVGGQCTPYSITWGQLRAPFILKRAYRFW